MFRFEHIEYLWALLLLPLFILFFLLMWRIRKTRMKQYADMDIISSIAPEISHSRPVWKFVLIALAFVFLIVALAGPQLGSKLQEVKRTGVEIMAVLDVSNSMMAQDIQPNRLERSRQALAKLTERLIDDKMGLIVFAGEAYIQLPMTTDYVSARMFLSSLNPEWMPVQGTAIGSAIRLGMRSFSPETEIGKAMIILTDGEDHQDDAIGAAREAAAAGINVHVIGVGLPEGAPIPAGSGSQEYIRDKEGNVVISKLNETLLRQIAAAGNGIFVRSNQAQVGLNTLFDEISKMKKGEYEARVFSEYENIYRWPAGIALLFLLIELLMPMRKANRIFSLKHLFTGIILIFLPSVINAQNSKQLIREGNRLYEKDKFSEAEISYRKSIEKESLSFESAYNLGNTLYKQERYNDAMNQYQTLIEGEKDAYKRSILNYNLGNVFNKEEKLQESAEAYKKALRDNPNDKQAMYNLSEVLRKIKEKEQQEQEQNEDNKDKDQDENKDQNQEQDENKDQNQEQDKDKQDENKDNKEQEQKDQPQPQEISEDDARRILELLQQEEKDILERLQQQEVKTKKVQTDKNW